MSSLPQLSHLRTLSSIDCDTLDATIASSLGPFVDCTSNQAIALFELQKPSSSPLLLTAAKLTLSHPVPTPTLMGDIASCLLSARILPHIIGYIHTQTNPFHAFSTSATIADARRLISIYASLSPPIPKERICIKIPATWEGLMACKALEAEGIRTLATTLFTLSQAKLAGEVGCTYVAPYVNALRVHFEPGYVDEKPGFEVAVEAQRWFEVKGMKTEVLAASFVSTEEVLKLRGLKHLTISPVLLQGLVEGFWDEGVVGESLVEAAKGEIAGEVVVEEAEWRLEMNREGGGSGAQKLVDAVNIFCEMQEKLEMLCAEVLEKVRAGV
ncbi:transaldolase [Wilcoxina mikolae CBS 423.85]|nr:transaldolase [Wilcoxina mikolae CBS 423.85]